MVAKTQTVEWWAGAFIVYDGVSELPKFVSSMLLREGVRTCIDLNQPGSLKSTRGSATAMTREIAGNCDVAIVFLTTSFLRMMTDHNDRCAVELEVVLAHVRLVIPIIIEEGAADPRTWKGDLGARLATLKAVNVKYEDSSEDSSEAARLAAWQVYYAIRDAIKASQPASLAVTGGGWEGSTDDDSDSDVKPTRATVMMAPSQYEHRGTCWSDRPVQQATAALRCHDLPGAQVSTATLPEGQRPDAERNAASVPCHSPTRARMRERGVRRPTGVPKLHITPTQGGRPLSTLSAMEVVALIERIGYGRYALMFRLAGIDGSALCRKLAGPPSEFASVGIARPSTQRSLHATLRKLLELGVPRDFVAGSAIGALWRALTGQHPEPRTTEQRYSDAVAARRRKEAAELTPRSTTPRMTTPRGTTPRETAGRDPSGGVTHEPHGGLAASPRAYGDAYDSEDDDDEPAAAPAPESARRLLHTRAELEEEEALKSAERFAFLLPIGGVGGMGGVHASTFDQRVALDLQMERQQRLDELNPPEPLTEHEMEQMMARASGSEMKHSMM